MAESVNKGKKVLRRDFLAGGGWPTRGTLEGLGMKKVADVMPRRGKLGGQGSGPGRS